MRQCKKGERGRVASSMSLVQRSRQDSVAGWASCTRRKWRWPGRTVERTATTWTCNHKHHHVATKNITTLQPQTSPHCWTNTHRENKTTLRSPPIIWQEVLFLKNSCHKKKRKKKSLSGFWFESQLNPIYYLHPNKTTRSRNVAT
jgi:hypothetical protein